MNLFSNLPAFPAYVGALLVLGVNVLGLANATALTRGKASEVVNPEDQALNKTATVVYEGGNDVTARYRRAHRNALENVPLFLITALVLTGLGASATVGAALFYPFAGLRVVHSFCYVKAIQPLRTIAFVLALLVQFAILGFIGYYAFVAPAAS
jgi:uncharacterized MAPEG superfamily protein